jgi:hypothetical protein
LPITIGAFVSFGPDVLVPAGVAAPEEPEVLDVLAVLDALLLHAVAASAMAIAAPATPSRRLV